MSSTIHNHSNHSRFHHFPTFYSAVTGSVHTSLYVLWHSNGESVMTWHIGDDLVPFLAEDGSSSLLKVGHGLKPMVPYLDEDEHP